MTSFDSIINTINECGSLKYGIAVCLVYLTMPGAVTLLVGVTYPTYTALASLDSREKDDERKWLTYWTVYAALNLVETFAGFILDMIPLSGLFRLVFLIWLQHPKYDGALTVYTLMRN